MNIAIDNGSFDQQDTSDGSAPSLIQGWNIEYGLGGLFNPPESAFIGEAGNGQHKNTLYLIDNSKVRQTLTTTVLANTEYKIGFDVGERADVTLSSYTIVVKAGEKELLRASNPEFPTQPGTFAHAEITFNSGDISGNLITIEVESSGAGHVNFDNFSLNYSRTNGSVLGEWKHVELGTTYVVNIDYLAETDGIITQYTGGHCNGNREVLLLTNPDGTSYQVGRTVDYDSMMSPVKKGQKWRIYRYKHGSNCNASIGFIPFK